MEYAAWIYIMTNKPRGVLYIGVTTDLRSRARHHRSGHGSAFTRKYNCGRLVYFEPYANLADARVRERVLKTWKRAWKIELIEKSNPLWDDLHEQTT